jgi:hypothetical protein
VDQQPFELDAEAAYRFSLIAAAWEHEGLSPPSSWGGDMKMVGRIQDVGM